MPVVPRDATKGWWFATTAAEATSLLSGTGIANPAHLWPMQEADVPFADGIGALALGVAGTRYDPNLAVAGFARKGQRSRGDEFYNNAAGLVDPSTTSSMLLAVLICEAPTTAFVDSQNIYIGLGGTYAKWFQTSAGKNRVVGGATLDGSATIGATPHVLALQNNFAAGKTRVVTDQEAIEVAIGAPATTKYIAFNGSLVASGAVVYLWTAEWESTAAELTTAQIQTLIDRIQNGPAITSIAISPTSAALVPAGTQSLVATATRADTSTVANAPVTWSSSNPAVATVDSSGVVTAVAVGTANITATFTSLNATTATSNTSVITVSSGVTLSSISVTPASPSINGIGSTQQMVATGTYSDATTANLTATATWSSLTPSVATVSATGLVTAIAVGAAVISATSGAITGQTTATITVSVVSTAGAFQADAFQADAFDVGGAVPVTESLSKHARMMLALLPPGRLWRMVASKMRTMFAAFADELDRLEARAFALLLESNPATTVEMVPEYEAELGLASTGTTAERSARIVATYVAQQGYRPIDFQTALAPLLGQAAANVVVIERTHAQAAAMGDDREIYRFFVYRDPSLGGTYYLASAQQLINTIEASHTIGTAIESVSMVCDSPYSLCDRDLLGA